MSDEDQHRREKVRRAAAAELAFGAVPTLVAAIVAGWFVGSWLDSRLSSDPVCMAVGVVAGACAGFFNIFRIARRLE